MKTTIFSPVAAGVYRSGSGIGRETPGSNGKLRGRTGNSGKAFLKRFPHRTVLAWTSEEPRSTLREFLLLF